jgi:hypothetical protein
MGATNSRTAAGIFFDFCTAFPALAHRWIFLVLDAMLVPLQITDSIRKLYNACSARMMFNGNLVGNIQILSGIKQGCPMSGSIFALAIDPLIRRILAMSVLHSIRITAFADDIAIVIANVFLQLPGIIRVFVLWEGATALKLNSKKTAFLPLWLSFDEAMLRRWLRHSVPAIASCSVGNCAKYLGLMLGPGATDHQWTHVASKVLVRAADANFAAHGIAAKLRHFRLHGTSTVLYKAQFAPLTPCMRQAYRKAEQRLTGSPWMAMPPDLLHSLRSLGLPAELPDIDTLALAAQLRVTASSATFWASIDCIEEALSSDEVLLHLPLSGWHDRSILYHLRRVWNIHTQLDPMMEIFRTMPRRTHQSSIYKLLRGSCEISSGKKVLARRLCSVGFTVDSVEAALATLCTVLSSKCLPSAKYALLRTVCNAWNTSARYHQPVACCLFGCPSPAEDRMSHYITCPCLASPALSLLGICFPPLLLLPVPWLFCMLSQPSYRTRTLLFIDALFFSYNVSKFGSACAPPLIFAGRVKDTARRLPGRTADNLLLPVIGAIVQP